MSLFRVEHLSKKFGGNVVVDDLSLHIDAGECLGVIGPNGAGKTTTIRMCLGLVAPDAGQYRGLRAAYSAAGARRPRSASAS